MSPNLRPAAKQVIFHKSATPSAKRQHEDFKDRIGAIITASSARRVGHVVVDPAGAEGVNPPRTSDLREVLRVGDSTQPFLNSAAE